MTQRRISATFARPGCLFATASGPTRIVTCPGGSFPLKAARETADRKAIRQALARSENNISNAAKLLGISRPTLYDLLKQYDLQP